MTIKEVEYPTKTKKFFVEDKGNKYTCYIQEPCNCMDDFVVHDFVTDKNKSYENVKNKRLEMKIILECKKTIQKW